jgi:hypothetical protein
MSLPDLSPAPWSRRKVIAALAAVWVAVTIAIVLNTISPQFNRLVLDLQWPMGVLTGWFLRDSARRG